MHKFLLRKDSNLKSRIEKCEEVVSESSVPEAQFLRLADGMKNFNSKAFCYC